MENTKCNGCTGKDPKMEEILNQYKQTKDNLIQILNEVQEHYGYIPTNAQMRVSEYLNIVDRRIDHARMIVPISASKIRENLDKYKNYLEPMVYKDMKKYEC